jgi:hypothetical protein
MKHVLIQLHNHQAVSTTVIALTGPTGIYAQVWLAENHQRRAMNQSDRLKPNEQ